MQRKISVQRSQMAQIRIFIYKPINVLFFLFLTVCDSATLEETGARFGQHGIACGATDTVESSNPESAQTRTEHCFRRPLALKPVTELISISIKRIIALHRVARLESITSILRGRSICKPFEPLLVRFERTTHFVYCLG